MNGEVRAYAEGKVVVLDFPSLPEALQMWKPCADSRRRREMTDMLHQMFACAGVSLDVRVQGKSVGHLGLPEKTGLILGLLGASGDTQGQL